MRHFRNALKTVYCKKIVFIGGIFSQITWTKQYVV